MTPVLSTTDTAAPSQLACTLALRLAAEAVRGCLRRQVQPRCCQVQRWLTGRRGWGACVGAKEVGCVGAPLGVRCLLCLLGC